jgi:hypothetical protein
VRNFRTPSPTKIRPTYTRMRTTALDALVAVNWVSDISRWVITGERWVITGDRNEGYFQSAEPHLNNVDSVAGTGERRPHSLLG